MVFAAAASMLAFNLPGRDAVGDDEKLCRGLTAIASDARKMRYVKNWIASHLGDERFMKGARSNPNFPLSGGRILFDYGYVGLSALAVLEFNYGIRSGGDDAGRVDSVSLKQIRSYIIIRLSPAKDFGLDWPPENLEKIRPVGDDVFVYCDLASENPGYPD